LIYRGKRLVNWDPVLKTALSDLEVVAEEESGSLWHLRYPLVDGGGVLVVATTRPETMLGDSAVAVHPDDERYRHLIGRQVRLPLTDRTIPIIGDAYVDPAFGSGCVKITPAHDFNDYEVGQRHGLAIINIMTPEAALNENAPPAYRGLDRSVARSRIVADLEALGLVERIEPHQLTVPRGDRSHAVLEPLLTDRIMPSHGKVVIATVKQDIHEIGKNLVAMMLKGNGFEVIDLGVDVAPDTIVEAVRDYEADVVALSALLTTTMPNMMEVVDALAAAGQRDHVKIMVGGAVVTRKYAEEIGADAFAGDSVQAVAAVDRCVGRA